MYLISFVEWIASDLSPWYSKHKINSNQNQSEIATDNVHPRPHSHIKNRTKTNLDSAVLLRERIVAEYNEGSW